MNRIEGEENEDIINIGAHKNAFYSLYRCAKLATEVEEARERLTEEQFHDAHEFVELMRGMECIVPMIRRDEEIGSGEYAKGADE